MYEELFSFIGAGTLFTEMQYGFVRPVSIDDFEEVEALIVRGQTEGHLLPRTPEQIAQILPSCWGYRIGDEHLAGICSLLTEPYRRDRAGEITAMYTLTRFQGEGVAAVLVREILKEARARRLKYLFACTSDDRVAAPLRPPRLRARPCQRRPRGQMARLRSLAHLGPQYITHTSRLMTDYCTSTEYCHD